MESIETLNKARQAILAAGFSRLEYLELRADNDLAPIDAFNRLARLLVAAWLGQTRLIDNVEVGSPKRSVQAFKEVAA
ncbi:pantoate--beta-alanine ligase [Mesorhizobium temperatum]|uniref:Pantoate--beta-alanine ligase n=1 Tax=Mesorhizobium temperatum TaxID=241416 RepID=A0A271LF27_9HYPH|nr:pantoate--beta-alanine ligase [Mesorhizobium temperatum]PAQ06723.1 hypothetical protein CIT26_24390 [Mesorhizobium temperatum]